MTDTDQAVFNAEGMASHHAQQAIEILADAKTGDAERSRYLLRFVAAHCDVARACAAVADQQPTMIEARLDEAELIARANEACLASRVVPAVVTGQADEVFYPYRPDSSSTRLRIIGVMNGPGTSSAKLQRIREILG